MLALALAGPAPAWRRWRSRPSLCSEGEDWCRRSMGDYGEYKKGYEALQTTFNPRGARTVPGLTWRPRRA